MLAKLIEGISLWSDLEARIANLPTEIDRGNTFEEFCQGFFILDPVHLLHPSFPYPALQFGN